MWKYHQIKSNINFGKYFKSRLMFLIQKACVVRSCQTLIDKLSYVVHCWLSAKVAVGKLWANQMFVGEDTFIPRKTFFIAKFKII